MSTYVFDIDGTLVTQDGSNYPTAQPIQSAIDKLNILYDDGHKIILMTARGSMSGIDHSEFTQKQMDSFGIKHHELIMNKKPAADFYIDDKALNVFDWLNGKNHNGPTLKYPIAEVADRYTICKLKHERIEAEDLSRQLAVLKAELDRYPGIETFISRLYKINGECWDMESEIRRGKEGILGLEEVGKRTLTLRDKNKIRVGIKNEIVREFGEGFEDIKMNHASEG
jgi:hypothetical protein